MSPDIIAIFLGLLVGLALALTGAGGAILSIPLLVFFLHLNVTQAAPIGLFALMLSAGAGALLGLKARTVRYKAAGLMAICGMLVAPLGVWLSHTLPIHLVGVLFSAVLLFVAWRMWHGSSATPANTEAAACQINPVSSKLFWTAPCTARLSLTGAFAGLLSGLLGVGGGFVIVPSLRKVSNFDMQTIIATSLTVIALVSTSGFFAFALHDKVDWKITLPFGLSAFVAMLLSQLFTAKVPARASRRAFAVLALFVAIGLALTSLGALSGA